MAALEMLARELNSHCCSQLLNTYKLGKMINSSCQNLLQQWLQLGAALLAGLAGRCTKGAFPSLRGGTGAPQLLKKHMPPTNGSLRI